MEKTYRLVFYKSELAQYNYILEDADIRMKVSAFLLKYVSVEAFYKKLLAAEREKDGKKLTAQEKKNLRVVASDVKRVLSYYDIDYQDDLIDRIFGSENGNYMNCTIKKLRDRMVHNVNENVLKVILERYDQMDNDLNEFINLFNNN